jgi:YfiH family protein
VNAPELSFDLPGGAHVLFTARAHGNLSSVGGDGAEHGLESRDRLRRQVGVGRLQRGYQVHGTSVQRVRDEAQTSEDVEADGQATTLPRLGVLVLTADCLPVALATDGAVAMVHAGWRGLAAGVLEEGVLALRELGGSGDLTAVIGPGAGPCCYEVGEEVHAAFGGAHRIGAPSTGDPSGQNAPVQRIDLKAIARERLLAAGASDVEDVAACTICDERFFSHRREGARAGRQGGVAWLS